MPETPAHVCHLPCSYPTSEPITFKNSFGLVEIDSIDLAITLLQLGRIIFTQFACRIFLLVEFLLVTSHSCISVLARLLDFI